VEQPVPKLKLDACGTASELNHPVPHGPALLAQVVPVHQRAP
jgi:hypothetical protein